jgi:hypothetical protein
MRGSSTGKWVSRAAATGSSRTYRGKTPVNWYMGLALILVLGLFSVGFARYEYAQTSSNAKPTTWYAGLSFVRCGTQEADLPASSAGSGVTTPGSGVLAITLQNRSQATLGRFVDGYPGLTLTSTELGYPGAKVLRNGDTCPAGTPYAGKKGVVKVVYWSNFSQSTGHTVSNPSSLALTNGQLVTAAFVPAGVKVPKPPQSTITAVLSAIGGSPPTTTTTTRPPVASTTTTTSKATTTTGKTATSDPGTTTSSPPTSTTSGQTNATNPANNGGGGGTAPPTTQDTSPPTTQDTSPATTTTAPPDTTTTEAPTTTTTTTG